MMTSAVNLTKYDGVVILVFNTGQWLFHERTSAGTGYYQEGSHVYGALYVVEVFHKAMATWARWITAAVDLMKMQVFFREHSVSHFGGVELHQPRYLETLMFPSVNTRRQFPTSYSDSFLLLECFPSLSQALSTGFAQFPPPVFQRCFKIIQSHMFSIDREIINYSFSLFCGPTADLGHGIICLVSQSNLRNLLLRYCLDAVPDVWQCALAFLRHLAIGCPVRLRLSFGLQFLIL